MIEPNDPANPTDNEGQNGPSSYHFTGLTKREAIAKDLMAAYLSSPNFKFDELSTYAMKAVHATRALINALNQEESQ